MASSHPAPEPPRGVLETDLAALWGRLLGRPQVGRHDRFLWLGGDSLLAGQLVTQVAERYGVALSLSDFFDGPTITEQAEAIRWAQAEGAAAEDSGSL